MMNSTTPTSTTSVPLYKGGFYQNSSVQLPPTPTSSSSASTIEKIPGKELKSLQIPASHNYGSLENSVPYFESSLSESRPVTPSQTTVSPNDNDEGLYLLWTQQLLRQRGFKPTPCTPNNEKDEDDDDSSISDMSSISSGEEEEEEGDNYRDQYIIEQRNLFSPTYQASVISHYSTAETTREEQEEETPLLDARQNSISAFFSSCFSSCL